MSLAADIRGLGRQSTDDAVVVVGGRVRSIHWGARLCLACGERRPRFFYRGVVKADRDHNLCFECFRAEVNRLRARRLASVAAWLPGASSKPAASSMIGDRAGLMLDLQSRRRRAQIMARHALDAPEPVPVAEPMAS